MTAFYVGGLMHTMKIHIFISKWNLKVYLQASLQHNAN